MHEVFLPVLLGFFYEVMVVVGEGEDKGWVV